PIQTGDVAVVNYTGTCEGKPITEIAPTAQGLTERKNFWIEVPSNSFIPGFSEQLIGASRGDRRTVKVDFPSDFVTPELASKRGVSREVIEQQKEQIYSAATHGAQERVKVAFLLQKIAEKEEIKVAQEEIAQRIHVLAATYQIPAEKFAKDLQERNGLIQIYDQVMNEKVIDLLQQNARIEDVPPSEPAAPELTGSNPS